ncbi:MAG: hypothetical protein P8Z37_14500, partial [Acidobacteriota bacterium]
MPAAFMRAPALVSPEIHGDNRVTFRLSAPDAKELTVSGDWMEGFGASDNMVIDEDGVWSVTVGPLALRFFPSPFQFVLETTSHMSRIRKRERYH